MSGGGGVDLMPPPLTLSLLGGAEQTFSRKTPYMQQSSLHKVDTLIYRFTNNKL